MLESAPGGMLPTILGLFRAFVDRTPDAACLTFEGRGRSYRELDQQINQVANALVRLGIQAGDRVGVLAQADPAFYELFFACAKIGAVMMPLNWRLSAREISGIVADAEPRLIIAGSDFLPLLDGIAGKCEMLDLEHAYAALREAAPAHEPKAGGSPHAPVLLLYTSGTTGKPKGVMISGENIAFSAQIAVQVREFTAESVNLVAMPLFHVGGIAYGVGAMGVGGHTVLLRQPDPPAVIAAMRNHGITHAFFVPTVLQRLVEYAEAQALNGLGLQVITFGGAPISEALLRRAVRMFGCRFSGAYGMTESSGTVACLVPTTDPDLLRSCGRPLPWVELAIVDPGTGVAGPPGEIGEIRLRSPMTMLGYWRNPEETRAAITPDGWLLTGDLGFVDGTGLLFVSGRYKDMIVSGGENVYPAEVENVLAEHDAVSEVSVVGIPHPLWGEAPRAYVVAKKPVSEDALIAFARERLAHYKCPKSIAFVDSLPKNGSGKVLKNELRALARREASRATE